MYLYILQKVLSIYFAKKIKSNRKKMKKHLSIYLIKNDNNRKR